MRYQSAVPGEDPNSVQFMTGSPTVYVHSGGSRSWRRYNPGLLGHGLFALQQGAIGGMKGKAIFASEAEGDKALRALLASEDLAYLTLEQAYKRFDPTYEPVPQPNPRNKRPPPPKDPYTGNDATVTMSSLSGGDREAMTQAIK